jgi:predicted alpha-1,6-mannanase (GH76 family)
MLAITLTTVFFTAAPRVAAQTSDDYHDRADAALQSFLLKYWNGGRNYLNSAYPSTGSLTGYWTFAHGWDALMDGVERTGGQMYSGLIESFYNGQNARGWFPNFYDDESWMCMTLIRAYDLTNDARYLEQAKSLYSDIETAWDTTCCGSNPGGIWWNRAHTQKATASNAGPALAGTRLYLRTGDASYLSFAQQVYSYWLSNMVDPQSFQVADHINPDGTVVWWRFTYNEGLMIGASVELYEASGDPTYLSNAYAIADFMITHEVRSTDYGNALYDGTNLRCGGDCQEFKGPAYRYLMRLFGEDTTQSAYFDVLKASADAIWNLARDPAQNIFAIDWAGPPMSSASEQQDNAAVMALNRFAQQYGPYPGSGLPPNQYEAENSTIHNIGLEARYAGYTGWGYLAGWRGDGQWVDFHINIDTAGQHTLTFRYAAGAGTATRLICINGADAFPDQSFQATGSWGNYGTVSVSYNLPAGANTISVIYYSSLGSSNYLNLDNLVVDY